MINFSIGGEPTMLIGGDCVSSMNNYVSQETIDSIITDPPYEISFGGRDWDNTGIAYKPKTWEACYRVLKPNGTLIVFGSPRTHHRVAHAMERAGFNIVDISAWCYGTGFPTSIKLHKSLEKNGESQSLVNKWEGWGTSLKPAWEAIIVATKKANKDIKNQHSPYYYVSKPSRKEKDRGLDEIEAKPMAWGNQAKAELKRGNLDFKSKNDGSKHNKVEFRKNHHPTVKPVELMKKLIEDFTNEGEIVLDPFAGSGTTGIACVLTDRKFVGFEIDYDFLAIAKARIDFTRNNKNELGG